MVEASPPPRVWRRPAPHDDGGQAPHTQKVANAYGEGIQVVDRLLSLRQSQGLDGTVQLAEHLTDRLRDACGGAGALWDRVRHRVRVFCPDGAPDEQLAGRLASGSFPNLRFVIRCAAHAAQGAVKNAFAADDKVADVTKTVVQELASFLRHSQRFQLRFGANAHQEAMAAVRNFDFAPQRFSSTERPLTRFLL